jgi:flagellar biosynthesis/type III secretory pathway chaperone
MNTTTQIPFEDLSEDLRVNMKLSQEIVDILQEENKALRVMATQDLLRISKQKENLLTKVHYLDRNLQEATHKIQEDNPEHSPQKSAPLSEVIAQLPAEQADIIRQYCHNIKQLRLEIQTQNLINKRFTHDTLTCLNEAISLITRPATQGGSYGAIQRGKGYTASQPNLISKEV